MKARKLCWLSHRQSSELAIVAIAPSLFERGITLHLRDITQAYVQSTRVIYARPPKDMIGELPPNVIFKVIKPLYGTPEAGAHWLFFVFVVWTLNWRSHYVHCSFLYKLRIHAHSFVFHLLSFDCWKALLSFQKEELPVLVVLVWWSRDTISRDHLPLLMPSSCVPFHSFRR